jgi:ATP-dependent DNA helicase Q1
MNKTKGRALITINSKRMKLVYSTPEKLVNNEFLFSIMDKLYAHNRIYRFVLDKVNCVSH